MSHLGKAVLSQSVSDQVNKWLQVKLILGQPYDGLASHPRESENSPSDLMFWNTPERQLGLKTFHHIE